MLKRQHPNRSARPSQPERRTRVWFENGRLMTNNPAAFAAAFELPATPPTDDGRVVVSVALGRKGGEQ